MNLPLIRKPTLALPTVWLSHCFGGRASYGRISVHTSCDYVRKDRRLRTAEVMAREELYFDDDILQSMVSSIRHFYLSETGFHIYIYIYAHDVESLS